MTKKISKLLRSDANKSLLSSIISILIGIFVGFLAMVIITFISPNNSFSDALGGLKIMFMGPFFFKCYKICFIKYWQHDILFSATYFYWFISCDCL